MRKVQAGLRITLCLQSRSCDLVNRPQLQEGWGGKTASCQVRNRASVAQQPAPRACLFSGRRTYKVLTNWEDPATGEAGVERAHTLSLDSKGSFISPHLQLPKGKSHSPSPMSPPTLQSSPAQPASQVGEHSRFHPLQKHHLLAVPFFPLLQPGTRSRSPFLFPDPRALPAQSGHLTRLCQRCLHPSEGCLFVQLVF